MAIDSKAKRMSMLNMGKPFTVLMPHQDGSVSADAMAHFLHLYGGISLEAPSVGPGGVYEGDGFNDVKVAALAKVTGMSTSLSNNLLEFVYLGVLVSGAGRTVQERWHLVFDAAGISVGDIDDRAYSWLGSLGHAEASIHRRWYDYWLDLGS